MMPGFQKENPGIFRFMLFGENSTPGCRSVFEVLTGKKTCALKAILGVPFQDGLAHHDFNRAWYKTLCWSMPQYLVSSIPEVFTEPMDL